MGGGGLCGTFCVNGECMVGTVAQVCEGCSELAQLLDVFRLRLGEVPTISCARDVM